MEKIKKRLKRLTIIVLSFIAIATIFYNQVEKLNLIDSIYLSISTISTVGYGDVVPKTNIGKLFTSAYVLVGFGLLFHAIGLFFKFQASNHHKEKIIELETKLIKEKEKEKRRK